MKKNTQKWLLTIFIIVIALGLISSMIAMFSMIELLTSFRIVFGSIYVLFLPGFILSYVFFNKTDKRENAKKGSIDWVERIALSFGLSIAIVPLVVFYLNLVGLAINLMNSFLTILGIILVSLLILVWKTKHKNKKK